MGSEQIKSVQTARLPGTRQLDVAFSRALVSPCAAATQSRAPVPAGGYLYSRQPCRSATASRRLPLQLLCSQRAREARASSHGHRGRHDDGVRRQGCRGGGARSRARRLPRRRPGPACAPVRGDAGGARRAGHRQADRAHPRPAAADRPRHGRQVQGLAGAHIPAGGAVRDVPVQPADGARLDETHLGLRFRSQDRLPPPPARCVLRGGDGFRDGLGGRRGVDRAQGQLAHPVGQDLRHLRQVLPPHRRLRLPRPRRLHRPRPPRRPQRLLPLPPQPLISAGPRWLF